MAVTWVGGSGLPGRHSRSTGLSGSPGHPTPRRWKRLPLLSTEGEASQSFSSLWGWLRFALGTLGTCLRREHAWGFSSWSVKRKGPVHWHWSIHSDALCVRMDRHPHVTHRPHHNHHTPIIADPLDAGAGNYASNHATLLGERHGTRALWTVLSDARSQRGDCRSSVSSPMNGRPSC